MRKQAIDALREIRSERSVDALIAALTDDDRFVREKVIEALKCIGSESSLDALVAALEDDRPDVRNSADKALRYIRSQSGGKFYRWLENRPLLIKIREESGIELDRIESCEQIFNLYLYLNSNSGQLSFSNRMEIKYIFLKPACQNQNIWLYHDGRIEKIEE